MIIVESVFRVAEKNKSKLRIPLFLGNVFKKSMGQLFVFLIITSAAIKIIADLIEILLDLVLKRTIEIGFVANQNLADLFKSPLAIAVIILALIIYCLIAFFEITAIITCIDYAYHDKKIRFGNIFTETFKNMKNALKPKNWGALIVSALLFPFAGIFAASNIIEDISLPEFIIDAIFGNTVTAILFCVFMVLIIIIALRLLFANTIFITEQKSWKESVQKARCVIKGSSIKSFLCVIIRRIFSSAVFVIIPVGISILIYLLSELILKNNSGYTMGAAFIYNCYIYPYAIMLFGFFSTVYVIAYIYLLYRLRCEDKNIEAQSNISFEHCKIEKRSGRKLGIIAILYIVMMAVIIVAVVTSGLIVQNNPKLIERLTPKTDVTAHRGDSFHAPESSAAAIKKAMDDGYTARIEFDVHPSKDGYAIVMHDASTKRTCAAGRDISDMTLSEIKELDCGSWFSAEFKGEKVLTLEELLELTDGFPLLLEIKNHSKRAGFEESIIDTLRKYDCTDRVMIHSMSYDSVVKAKIAAPEIPCGLIMVLSLGDFQDLPFVDFYSIEHTLITGRDISFVHMNDKKIFAWTVNEEEYADEMVRARVDSIITDNPKMVYDIIKDYSGNED